MDSFYSPIYQDAYMMETTAGDVIFGTYFMTLLICSTICGLITYSINKKKGYGGGFAWGFFLGIIGIIVVAARAEKQVQHGEADEILKYKKLLDDGVISQEEFENKKKKLMKS